MKKTTPETAAKGNGSPYLSSPYKAPPPAGKKVSPSSSSPSNISNSPKKIKQSSDGVNSQLSSEKTNDKKVTTNTVPKKSPSSINATSSKLAALAKASPSSPLVEKSKKLAIKPSAPTKSPSNFDKYAAFKKVPSHVVLVILDFYGGMFKKSSLTENGGKLDYSSFIKKFYGRFSDRVVKFLFRFIEGDHQAINNMRESIELVRLSFVSAQKIIITGSVADYLLNCPNKADPSLAVRKLELFASSLGEDCKKVVEIDFLGRDTFSELCSLTFKSFTNLEVIKGGRHMRKRRENEYDVRYHPFDNSMASALEVGGPNVKEIKWVGSQLPKNLASFTPNLEKVHVECPQSIISSADLLCEWKKLKSIFHAKHEVYIDYNPPPVNVTEYTRVFNSFVTMEYLQELTIFDDNRIPLDCFKLLENNQNLTKLNMDSCSLGTDFMKIVGTISNLKHFSAGSGSMTSQSLQNLLSLKQLQELKLDQCDRITEAGCEILAKITTLRLLEFSNTNLRDKGASMLVSLKNLRHLDLSCSLITNSMVDSLVKGCKKLTYLNVTGCKYVYMDKFKEDVRKKIKKYH